MILILKQLDTVLLGQGISTSEFSVQGVPFVATTSAAILALDKLFLLKGLRGLKVIYGYLNILLILSDMLFQ